MRFCLRNVNCYVEDASEEEERWLREFLAFEDGAAKFRGRYRASGDGRLMLYSIFRHTFPTGLLGIVLDEAKRENRTVEVKDERERPCEPDGAADLSWLRDYQRAAVDSAISATRGIVKAATGSGKTEIMIALVRSLPCRWLMLVHRTSLVRQAAERFELRTGEKAGIVSEGKWDEGHRFVCASFQTILAGLRSKSRAKDTEEFLRGFDGVLADECHTVAAATSRVILNTTRSAYWRFGFSGTPLDRTDQRSIFAVAALGSVVHTVSAQSLVEAGVLARPDIRLVEHRHVDPPTDASYSAVYASCVAGDERRAETVVECVRACEKPALVFVREIEHGKRTTESLLRAGIRSAFAWGSTATAEREDLVSMLMDGTFDVLVCSVVFQEGIDIPALRSVVNASGGKSIIATIQRIGRGMRRADGKESFEVWDVFDVGQKWLVKHSRAREKAYRREGFDVKKLDREDVEQMNLDSPRRSGV